jgi:hypothetical protein
LNEGEHQQQEEDKSKRSSGTNENDAFKMSERNKNTSSKLPNQYAKVKNAVKGEEEVQNDTDHNYGFVDEFLEEALNTSNIYEAQQDTDYDFWISDHNVHTSISINNTLYILATRKHTTGNHNLLAFFPAIAQDAIFENATSFCA